MLHHSPKRSAVTHTGKRSSDSIADTTDAREREQLTRDAMEVAQLVTQNVDATQATNDVDVGADVQRRGSLTPLVTRASFEAVSAAAAAPHQADPPPRRAQSADSNQIAATRHLARSTLETMAETLSTRDLNGAPVDRESPRLCHSPAPIDAMTPHGGRRPSFASLQAIASKVIVVNRLSPSPSSATAGRTSPAAVNMRHEDMIERFQVRRVVRPSSFRDMDGGLERTSQTSKRELIAGTDQVQPQQESASDASDHSDSASKPLRHPSFKQARSYHVVQTHPTIVEMSQGRGDGELTKDIDVNHGDTHSIDLGRSRHKLSGSGRFSLQRKLTTWKKAFMRQYRFAKTRLSSPIYPLSRAADIRNVVVLGALTVYIVIYPIARAFDDSAFAVAVPQDTSLELLLLADTLLSFNTVFVGERGELVTSRRKIAQHYLRGWFVPDLVSSLPLNLLLGQTSNGSRRSVVADELELVLRLVRTLHTLSITRSSWHARVNRSGRGVWTWLVYSRYSHLFRITWLVLFIVLIAHYMACAWRLLGGNTPSDDSVATDASSIVHTLAQTYALSFYDALQLLQGQGVTTTTVAQSVFASFAVLLGSIVLAIVFGHVAMLVANFSANATNYQRKMEAVFAVTSKMQLPEPLRERIHQYYDHIWREYELLDGEIERFGKSLSHTLELEIVLYKYMDLVIHIPFWAACSADFQKQLMLSLRVRVYLPDDFVMRRGEVDDEFYMISRGSVELATGPDSFERAIGMPLGNHDRNSYRDLRRRMSGLRTDSVTGDDGAKGRGGSEAASTATNHRKLTTLQRGQGIGELALFMNYQRTADVRALTYVEMCVFGRRDFQRILVKHPEDRQKVVALMFNTCLVRNETTGVFCPLKQMVRDVYSDGDAAVANTIDAKLAASILAEVVNFDLQDTSIRFGINTDVKQRLVNKRAAEREHTRPVSTLQSVAESPRQQQQQPLDDSSMSELKAQIAVLKEQGVQSMQSQQQLTAAVTEMRAVLDHLLAAERRRSAREEGGQHTSSADQPSALTATTVSAHAASNRSQSSALLADNDAQPRQRDLYQVPVRFEASRVSAKAYASNVRHSLASIEPYKLLTQRSSDDLFTDRDSGRKIVRRSATTAATLSATATTSVKVAPPTRTLLRRLSAQILLKEEQAPTVSATPFADQLFRKAAEV